MGSPRPVAGTATYVDEQIERLEALTVELEHINEALVSEPLTAIVNGLCAFREALEAHATALEPKAPSAAELESR